MWIQNNLPASDHFSLQNHEYGFLKVFLSFFLFHKKLTLGFSKKEISSKILGLDRIRIRVSPMQIRIILIKIRNTAKKYTTRKPFRK